MIACAIAAALSPGAAFAAFPGGNGLIAFSGHQAGESGFLTEIFTIRPDGSGLQQLTDQATGLAAVTQPSWSADGRRLVYSTEPFYAETETTSVFTIDIDGGEPTRVLDLGNARVSPAPSFSPSGRRILYTTLVGTREEGRFTFRGSIRTIRTNGSKPRRLLRGFLSNAQYSPSGKRIVFAGTPKRKSRSGIWTMRRDGSRLRRLTDPKKIDRDLSDTAPDYSPDGRHIVFTRAEFMSDVEIRVMRANGSHGRRIPGAATVFDHPEVKTPAYAPAGDRIVVPFVTGTREQSCSDLYTFSPRGADKQNLTNDCDSFGLGGSALFPSWQPVR